MIESRWINALIAVGAATIGFGSTRVSDQLLRPGVEKTIRLKATQTATSAARATVAQPPTTITKTADATTPPPEVLMTGSFGQSSPGGGSGGPFVAHIVNGIWTKSTPLEPNLPVPMNTFAHRNRVYSPDRIQYPMKRVDWDPSGSRNPQNRGKSQYVRITWKEALDTIASELKRVKSTYGPSAICLATCGGHQWAGVLHNNGWALRANGWTNIYGHPCGWSSRFFGLLGGYTNWAGTPSDTGCTPALALTIGPDKVFYSTNDIADVLANSKLAIFWSSDPARSYTAMTNNISLQRMKTAGIKQVYIDPYYNDSMSTYGDQWVPVIPATDEAMMAAIAYEWETQSTYDKDFVNKYAFGFDKFQSYVLGTSDGTPKTPQWASTICGIDATTIASLAREWASKPTAVFLGSLLVGMAGANRRFNAASWVRMAITLCAMQGMGLPGRGLACLESATRDRGIGMPHLGVAPLEVPPMTEPIEAYIRAGQFKDAVLNPPITWTETDLPHNKINQLSYPAPGNSEIHLIAFTSGSGYALNQFGNTNEHTQALQSPKIEFVYSHAAWWETAPKFSDIILPITFVGEREDLDYFNNYVLFIHQLATPPGEAMSDLDIYTALATRLGFHYRFTMGKTPGQWLRDIYAHTGIPLSYNDFKAQGFYKYPASVLGNPTIAASWQSFLDDPVKNPLTTPSGLIEIESQLIKDFFGATNATQSAIPRYKQSPEGLGSPRAQMYPLYMVTAHPKFGEHSQWRNLSWQRDEKQDTISGYNAMRINPVDATARRLKDGDVVRVYNDRGAILCGVDITERIRPSVVRIQEGGWYTPQQPGVVGSLDLGGNVNVLISGEQPEPVCDGMHCEALVQVEKWSQQ